MKIAMVSEHANPLAHLGGVDAGGQNVVVAELSAALAAVGHEVVVFTRRDDPDVPARVDTAMGYSVIHVPAGPARHIPKDELLQYMGSFSRFLDEYFRGWRPDIAHAHFWMSGLATLPAAALHHVPMVQTFHALGAVKRRYQGIDDTSPPARIRLEGFLARASNWVAATCSDEVAELNRMGRPITTISIVPCGVDVEHFTPDGPASSRGRQRRIVSVGRLVPRKGFSTLIEAMRSIPGTELVIVGGPDKSELDADTEAQRLQQLAVQLGVGDRVHLYGSLARDEMPMLLRSADLVAVTPWYEPFGIVPLEAMACGIPVVGSAVGGLLDTVVPAETGFLVPPKNPNALAEAINSVLGQERLRRGLGAGGRHRVCARYTWKSIAAETVSMYRKVVPVDQATASGGAR